MNTAITFLTSTSHKVAQFDIFAKEYGLVDKAKADHICYKCASSESFERIRKIFENESEYIYQAIISKRRIAYIKFNSQVETLLGPIRYLELSDQKLDNSQVEGFDHIEIYSTVISYDEMIGLLPAEKVIKVERPHHTTHDVDIEGGFLVRCTVEPLIEKIAREALE